MGSPNTSSVIVPHRHDPERLSVISRGGMEGVVERETRKDFAGPVVRCHVDDYTFLYQSICEQSNSFIATSNSHHSLPAVTPQKKTLLSFYHSLTTVGGKVSSSCTLTRVPGNTSPTSRYKIWACRICQTEKERKCNMS